MAITKRMRTSASLGKNLYTPINVRKRAYRRLYLSSLFLIVIALYGYTSWEGTTLFGVPETLSAHAQNVVSEYTMSTEFQARQILSAGEASILNNIVSKTCPYQFWDYSFVILYIVGAIYCFFGLAIVTDDYFVPSLERITEVLHLSEDVAGATFMAAGSSAPELFTSMIATLVANSDVGIGTIVGSAVFNILIIVGLTTLLSGQTLHLDWRPLTRDSVCYGGSIILLLLSFIDGEVHIAEICVFLLYYAGYIILMFFNKQLMGLMTDTKNATYNTIWGRTINEVPSDNEDEEPFKPKVMKPLDEILGEDEEGKSVAGSEKAPESEAAPESVHSLPINKLPVKSERKSSMTIDGQEQVFDAPDNPFVKKIWKDAYRRRSQENLVDDSADAQNVTSTAASGKIGGDEVRATTESPDFDAEFVEKDKEAAAGEAAKSGEEEIGGDSTGGVEKTVPATGEEVEGTEAVLLQGGEDPVPVEESAAPVEEDGKAIMNTSEELEKTKETQAIQEEVSKLQEELVEDEQDIELMQVEAEVDAELEADAKPRKWWKRVLSITLTIVYWIFALPYKIAFWLTIPPCSGPCCNACLRWLFPITFVHSVIWIGILSFIMVDFAERTGCTIGIPSVVMGLTFVAAGTSVPDSLSSISVAREGQGDMAIANALGSNVFDICFGLAFPWFCKSVFVPTHGSSIDVGDNGKIEILMFIGLLFLVLFWVYGIILIRSFQLAPMLGIIFLATYVFFIIWVLVWTYAVADLVE